MGAAVGMALTGLRPVVEMRVVDFALCAIDEIVNQAAKNRYMFGGQGRVPLVVRMPSASGPPRPRSTRSRSRRGSRTSRDSSSSRRRRRGQPRAARRRDRLRRSGRLPRAQGAVGRGRARSTRGTRVPLGRAARAPPGRDLTLVSWSKAVHAALAAAEQAAARGRDVEVIDLRTLWPWDREAVLASAARTGRLLVVARGGRGRRVSAPRSPRRAAEALGIRVARLGAPRIPVGYASSLEDGARVSPAAILGRIESLLA